MHCKVYESLGTGESTDEILSRLLKEHEMRITYKLLTEDFTGDEDYENDVDLAGPASIKNLISIPYKVWYI